MSLVAAVALHWTVSQKKHKLCSFILGCPCWKNSILSTSQLLMTFSISDLSKYIYVYVCTQYARYSSIEVIYVGYFLDVCVVLSVSMYCM